MKPIEPGCLAVILGRPPVPDILHGKTVSVKELVYPGAEIEGFTYRPRFNVPAWVCELGNMCFTLHERYLLRIDGGEDLETVEERERERVDV